MTSVPQKRILVLCTTNRARSQMAEGWLRHFGGERVLVYSAGTRPAGVHPLAVEVMAEAGIDISMQRSHHVDEYAERPFDVVVTLCNHARDACPRFPNARQVLHRAFDDPDFPDMGEAGQQELFRRVRDQIRIWARRFVMSINAQDARAAGG